MRKHTKVFRIGPMICGAILAVTGAIATSGCLTGAQKEAYRGAMEARDHATAYMLTLDDEIATVVGWIKAKKIDAAEGKALIENLKSQKDEARKVVTGNLAAIRNLKANETPWYAYLFYALNAAAGIATPLLAGRKAGKIVKAFGSVSRGLEAALVNAPSVATPNGESVDIERYVLEGVDAHVKRDDVRDTVKELHHDAINNRI